MKLFLFSTVGLIMIFCPLLGCSKSGEDELHLLPKDYIGPVLIIFDQPDGQPRQYENGVRIYEIPPSGVLKTQFKSNYGTFSTSYYYTRDDSLIREIPDLTGREMQEAEEGLYVYRIMPGSISSIEHEENVSETGATVFHFRRYIVGSLAKADSMAKRAEKLLDMNTR